MIESAGFSGHASGVVEAIQGGRILRHVREIALYNRALGSAEYHEAAQYVLRCLERAGLKTGLLKVPLDGKTMPGNWTFPRAWEPESAVFRVTSPVEQTLVTFQEHPVCLHSWSAATPAEGVEAELVYVGDGTREEDYAGVDVGGKIVLADRGANWLVYRLAIEERGALGYVSDDILEIPGLKTREKFPDMLLWYTFYEEESDGKPLTGWGFSISPRQGDYLRGLLRQGRVTVFAHVDAKTFEGVMESPVGVLEGGQYPEEEMLLVGHLCHPRPSAMDNAAGCAILLEVAEVISSMIDEGLIRRPKRSVSFVFGPEGHVSNAYPAANKDRLDDILGSLVADTVGASPAVAGGPLLLSRTSVAKPSFIDTLCADLLKRSSRQYPAVGEPGEAAEVEDGLGHRASPFKFEVVPYGMHSDNACLCGWGIPSVGLIQWPAIFWHTQYDTADNLDSVELQRVAWVSAMMALKVADAGVPEAISLMHDVERASERALFKLTERARRELLVASGGRLDEMLVGRQDELKYLVETGSQALASALRLVRHEKEAVRAQVQDVKDGLVARLGARRREEADGLEDFARMVRRR